MCNLDISGSPQRSGFCRFFTVPKTDPPLLQGKKPTKASAAKAKVPTEIWSV